MMEPSGEMPKMESYGDDTESVEGSGYPEFTPPTGTIPEGSKEGEATVLWRKKDDGTFCIVEFEGEPIGSPSGPAATPSVDEDLNSMATS